MNEIIAVVEGQTEQAFVRDVLAPYFGLRGVSIAARLPGRHVRRGGSHPWDSVRGDILRTLKERPGRVCTTMFDFYGLPNWPGRAAANSLPTIEKGTCIETALLSDLATHAGDEFLPELFIPYVQVHEFEALLFANVNVLADRVAPLSNQSPEQLRQRFAGILDSEGTPEDINDRYETCPSRRIIAEVPAYKKLPFGPEIAAAVGLETIRSQCPHFNDWLIRLESAFP